MLTEDMRMIIDNGRDAGWILENERR